MEEYDQDGRVCSTSELLYDKELLVQVTDNGPSDSDRVTLPDDYLHK